MAQTAEEAALGHLKESPPNQALLGRLQKAVEGMESGNIETGFK